MGLPDNRIPEAQLPKCWSDDIRMNALFAPFRLKSSNPESWEMKMKFWSEQLKVWCRCKEDPILSAADAKVAFQRKGRSPACIDIVIEEMFRNGDLSPITKYQQILHNGAEGWVRWGARLAFKPAAIAFTAVTFMLPKKQLVDNDGLPKASIDSTQRFVLESAVQDQATSLLQNFPLGAERLGTIDDLMATCNRSPSQREAFEIQLGYLVSQGWAAKKGDIVKLASTTQKVSPITESDEALYKLICAERNLSRDATRFARDAAAAAADAKATLQLGNRLAAKAHLRRKHQLQDRADKCTSALENVRQLLHNMREMEVNAAVLDTYRTSSAAMKRGMSEGGLTEDSVHDTMDDLKDVLTSYHEVERALSTSQGEDLDAAELEEELMELLAQKPGGGSGGTPQKADESPNLPSPPKTQPLSSRKPRVNSERDFIFDGEAQMLAELESLDTEDGKLSVEEKRERVNEKERARGVKVKVGAGDWSEKKKDRPTDRPSQAWYPKDSEFASKEAMNKSLDELCNSFAEIRTDQRLHPGQKLLIDYRSPPALYRSEFEVQDQIRVDDGVWLYNCREGSDDLHASTEFESPESPRQRVGLDFIHAPGAERPHRAEPWRPDLQDESDPDATRSESDSNRVQFDPSKVEFDPNRVQFDPSRVQFDREPNLGPGYIGSSINSNTRRHNSIEDLQKRLDSLRGFKM